MQGHDFVVRTAVGSDDHEAVYRGRHAVYVDEMGAMSPRSDGRIRDRFDARPNTLNLVVETRNRIVGGARFVADDGSGTTADAYFDFTPYLPEGSLTGAGSMLWMLPEGRGRKGLITEMMSRGLGWCLDQGLTHVLATVNPPVAARFQRVGYKLVGTPFLHGPDQLPVQPMMLETGAALAKRAA